MKVTKPEVKSFIYDVISLEDRVNGNQQPVARATYNKQQIKGVLALKNAIRDQVEVQVADKTIPKDKLEEKDIQWIPYSQMDNKKSHILGERHTQAEIELTDKMLAALKYYYKDRDELPTCSLETLEEVEKIVS